MTRLEEIYLTSNAPREMERFRIIREFVPGLKKLSIASQFINIAKSLYDTNIEICEIETPP